MFYMTYQVFFVAVSLTPSLDTGLEKVLFCILVHDYMVVVGGGRDMMDDHKGNEVKQELQEV